MRDPRTPANHVDAPEVSPPNIEGAMSCYCPFPYGGDPVLSPTYRARMSVQQWRRSPSTRLAQSGELIRLTGYAAIVVERESLDTIEYRLGVQMRL